MRTLPIPHDHPIIQTLQEGIRDLMAIEFDQLDADGVANIVSGAVVIELAIEYLTGKLTEDEAQRIAKVVTPLAQGEIGETDKALSH
jgi:hypothetical protein